MHVFKYSPRKGTVAAKMKNQISGEKKEFRSKKLLELSDINERKYLKEYLDKKVDVLFEEREGEFLKGHTSNYIMVKSKFDTDELLEQIVDVKISDVADDFLIGNIKNEIKM
jgi:threonylcarbamoyladenosine tRNA methylthiotransferase MtaB